jgi:carbonic anhydrase
MKKRIEALKRLRHSAGLGGYPLPAIHDEQRPAKALVITCSESPVLGMFASSIDPLLIFQNWGGTPVVSCTAANGHGGIDSECDMIQYAIDTLGLEHIVLCGHSKCRVPALLLNGKWACSHPETPGEQLCAEIMKENPTTPEEHLSRIWLARQMARLDDWLAEIDRPKENNIVTHALWFDEHQGDIFTYSKEKKQFLLMSDIDMERLFDALESGHHHA